MEILQNGQDGREYSKIFNEIDNTNRGGLP